MLTDQQHPITPPPEELVQEWSNDWHRAKVKHVGCAEYIATQAARWGADQELHALLAWLRVHHYDNLASDLLAARRPKPPSLAEDALKALQDQIDTSFKISSEAQERANTIRRALERLQELEEGNE